MYDMIKPYTTQSQAEVKFILIYIKDYNLSLTQFCSTLSGDVTDVRERLPCRLIK